MNKTKIAMLTVCLVLAFSAHAQNLLFNPSFESPAIEANTVSETTPTAWLGYISTFVPGSSIRVLDGNYGVPEYPGPLDGRQYVELVGNVRLDQVFTVLGPGTYELNWSDNSPNRSDQTGYEVNILVGEWLVIFDGPKIAAQTNLSSHYEQGWLSRAMQFNLDPGTYTLRFASKNNLLINNNTTLIDGVSLIGVQASAPILEYLSPSSATAGATAGDTADVQLLVHVQACSAVESPEVRFGSVSLGAATNEVGNVSSCFFASNFVVNLPGSVIFAALPAGSAIATIPVTVLNGSNPGGESNPLLFTVISSAVDPATVQTALVPPGGSTTVQSINSSTGGGVSATLTADDLSAHPVAITVANYSSAPTPPGTIFEVSGGYYDVQISGADAGDSVTVKFFYPGTIAGASEADLALSYFDGTGWPVLVSASAQPPAKDTSDGPASDPYGGFFTFTFDINSTPSITGLGGTVFALAPAPFSALPSTLWPPDHKMVTVTVNAPGCTIVSVSSNEPQTGLGNGNLGPDWQIIGPLNVKLRAERKDTGDGRIYTILLQCSDGTQNIALVRVPHDKLKK